MRMEDDIGCYDLILELGMLSRMARILMFAHVPPGPAIKAASLPTGDVIGNEIVPQPIALIDRTPQRTGRRLDCESYAIPDAIGIHTHRRTVGIEFQHIGAILLRGSRIRVVDVRP